MIARLWHGFTKPEHADAYEAMLKPELLRGLSKVKGYLGSYLLRRNIGNEVEFITIIHWESIDAIRAVAGPDHETAVIPGSVASIFRIMMPKPRIIRSSPSMDTRSPNKVRVIC